VPADPVAFGRLPGVGRYTAGAVLSIAFGRSLPVLDGNVARVFSRQFGMAVSVRDPLGARALWATAAMLVPMQRAGDWNQALMELGATICLPRSPLCQICPFSRTCLARREGRIDELPPMAPRRATVRVRRAIALVESRGRWLVERLSGGLLEGMWEPPGVELSGDESAAAALSAKLRGLGILAPITDSGRRVKHTITHRRIEVELWRAGAVRDAKPARRVRGTGREPGGDSRAAWVAGYDRAYALTSLARKALGQERVSGTAPSRRPSSVSRSASRRCSS
jgi:A/G-specific adenine glycosylase